MGCKTRGGYDFGICSGLGANPAHCYNYTAPAGSGVTFSFLEYPENNIRSGNYNIPGREDNNVMYPFIDADVATGTAGISGSGTGASSANCGKIAKPSSCRSVFSRPDGISETPQTILDYFPNELSFDYCFSDTWFSYLYDTSVNSGIIGIPCFYIETETRSTTTPGPNDPGTGQPTSTSSGGSRQICRPCTAFTSTPEKTLLTYTAEEDLTGDVDCPHPTLFAVDTDSKKIVVSYDELSTILPNGVTDFDVSYDGVTYAEAWDEKNSTGVIYESSQNPWKAGDESLDDFEIFDFTSGVTKSNFVVKAKIRPIFDDTGATTVFSGTRWIIDELLNPGTGYAVNDVFTLSYSHRHDDGTDSVLTLNIKVTSVGPITNVTGQTGFDILRVNDTLNGHTVTRAFHTDVDNFQYHVIYVDGNGSDFTKDTQYTSDRNHVVTVVAGYGIKDRACLVGLYEFLNKSLQFSTADLNKNTENAFNTIIQPSAFVTLTNGGVSGLSFNGEVLKFDVNSIENNLEDSYSDADNVSLSYADPLVGGTGSGVTANIRTGDDGSISQVIVSNPGSGYQPGDLLSIPGATKPSGTATNATIRVLDAANPGSGFIDLKVKPILEINGSPSSVTPTFSDGLEVDINFPDTLGEAIDGSFTYTFDGVVYSWVDNQWQDPDGNPAVIQEAASIPSEEDASSGERDAVIEGTFTGGSLSSVVIKKSGSGYNADDPPNVFVKNIFETVSLTHPNEGYRGDLVPEFQGVVKSLPTSESDAEGQVTVRAEDLQAIDDSYSQIPKETDIKYSEPKLAPKYDKDRERIRQLSQQKYSSDATEPLKEIMVVDYDLSYLKDTDIDSERKNIITDNKKSTEERIISDIDTITQKVIPEYDVKDEVLIETCNGSFTNLPTSSAFTKYVMRQYRPDPAKQTSIEVSLNCIPQDIGCAHITCAPPALTPGSTSQDPTGEVDENGDPINSTSTYSYLMSPLLGPGAQEWTATGTITMFHDLTRDAQTVILATEAYGNPFDD
ncbi:hypothetical protein Syn7803US62_71 [Synechococcus phage ACG-2014a]|uniref:Baseplate wedge initiator n=1 Tax=Synechococcus phage ACG-2014a TaxID=1493507 RepID=A0A0E3HNP0_9CAUD|nr:hypothetical protein Syn7803US62_71 [Synechococcus phage ACG-2014a]